MNFRFINKTEPSDYVTQLANNMHKYRPEHIVAGGELIFEKDLAASNSFLQHLLPSNCIVSVFNKSFAGRTTERERWYGTEHNKKPFSSEQLHSWNEALRLAKEHSPEDPWATLLHLPLPNVFVPTDFSLKGEVADATASTPASVESYPLLVDCILVNGFESEDEIQEDQAALTPASDLTGTTDAKENGESEGEGDTAGNGDASVPIGRGKHSLTWFKQDDSWKVPKGSVLLTLESVFCSSSPLSVVLTDLLAQLLKEVLSEYSYYADCAGLFYEVQLSKGGMELSFQGYNHKLQLLVTKALQELRNVADKGGESGTNGGGDSAVSQELFLRVKERCLQNYKNYLFWQPYYHCLYGSLVCLEEPRWSNAEKYHALKPSTLSDLLSFANVFLRSVKAELLVHGNFLPDESTGFANSIRSILRFSPLPLSQEPIRRVVRLAAGDYVFRQFSKHTNPKEVNSAVENIYLVCPYATFGVVGNGLDPQCEVIAQVMASSSSAEAVPSSIALEALLELLTHMLSEPAFDQLRTKEQLGYIVFSGIKKVGQLLGVQIIVQSSHTNPTRLDLRVEAFLIQYRTDLADTTAEALQGFVAAVCEKLLEKPKNIDQESSRYWEEIKSGSYLFDRKKQLAAALQATPVAALHEALLLLFDSLVLKSSHRKKFSSQFFGKGANSNNASDEKKPEAVVVRDAADFKRSLQLHSVLAAGEDVFRVLMTKGGRKP